MNRADAIALYGLHYETDDDTIAEILGPARPNSHYEFASIEAARSTCSDEARRAQRNADDLQSIFISRRGRFLIWRIENGLVLSAGRKRARLAAWRGRLKTLTDQAEAWKRGDLPKVKPLPDDIRIPPALAVGTPVFVVKTTWFEDGIKNERRTVAKREIRSCGVREPWDYTFDYVDDAGDGFRAGGSGAGVEYSSHGWTAFLDEDAAKAHARRLAEEMLKRITPFLPTQPGPALAARA